MKKNLIKGLSFFVDKILLVPIILLAPFLKLFLKFGPRRMTQSTKLFKMLGVFPIDDHYYQPLFNDKLLLKPLNLPRELPGIEFNLEEQIKEISEFTFFEELKNLNFYIPSDFNNNFDINNGGFGPGDADFLYSFIRKHKPRKIIEIGSGNSTKIVNLANQKNIEDMSLVISPEHICIEPYEMSWLESFDVSLIRKKVEDCDIELFSSLGSGDFLFIDSSHIIRPQGDVLFEYQNILPILKKGVIIHIHDVFSPRDYLDDWIKKDVKMWNEQYLLESLLTYSTKFKIKYSLNNIKHTNYEILEKACPYISKDSEPGSIYIEVL